MSTPNRFESALPISHLLGDDTPVIKPLAPKMPSPKLEKPAMTTPSVVTTSMLHHVTFQKPTMDVVKMMKFQHESIPSPPPPPGPTPGYSMAVQLSAKSHHDAPPTHTGSTINVFYERVMESCLYGVPFIGSDRSLSNLSHSLFEFFAVLPENQLVTVMHANEVVTYAIRLITQSTAASIRIPPGACILLAAQPVGRGNLVLRRTWPAASHLRKKRPIDADDEVMQDIVRERMTKMLSLKGKGVNLQIISELSQFSKAALSQWRRNQYKGNTQAIATAVAEALDEIDACRDKFGVPSICQQQSANGTKRMRFDPNDDRRDSMSTVISAVSSVSVPTSVPESDGNYNSDEEDWEAGESQSLNTLVEGMVLAEMLDSKRRSLQAQPQS